MSRLSLRRALAALACLLLLAAGLAPGSASTQTLATPTPTAGRSAAPSAPPGTPAVPRGAAGKPSSAKLGSALAQLVAGQAAGRLEEVARSRQARLHGDRVKVTIQAEPGRAAAATQAVRAAGGQAVADWGDLVDAYVPVAGLPALAAGDPIRRVDLPVRPHPDDLPARPGAATGEGVALIGAQTWHEAGLTGRGVKVGIIDLGFTGYPDRLGTKLPASVDTSCNPNPDGNPIENGEAHGLAVAEVVHEVAPGAELYFANAETVTELGRAVDCLAGKGVTVINHSVAWMYQAAGDGTGPVNSVVAGAVGRGLFWANSGGNSAQNHWAGTWTDADGDNRLEFNGSEEYLRVSVAGGDTITIGLRWDDVWGGACNDYDLYLWDNPVFKTGLVAVSDDVQDCSRSSRPLEVLSYTPSQGGTYYIQVSRHAGSGTHRFDLMTFAHPLPNPVTAGSLFHPADSASPGMMAVGAVRASAPTTLRSFSAQGPTTDNRIKPDLVGPDAVTNSVYGTFSGTSASSPHVAGAAALVKAAFPAYTPVQIKAFLTERAVDVGPVGPDNQFGAGRLNLGPPPTTSGGPTGTATATPTPTTTTPTPGATPTGLPTGGTGLRLITPVRVVDTRGSDGGPIGFNVDGTPIGAGKFVGSTVRRYKIAGRTFAGFTFPSQLSGLLLNVTVVQSAGSGGYVTVFPGDALGVPNASTLNPSTAIAANFWSVAVPTSGQYAGTIAVYSTNTLDLVIDVAGYVMPPGHAQATSAVGNLRFVTPVRVLDTRGTDGGPIGIEAEGVPVPPAPLQPNTTGRFQLAGRTFGGVTFPADTAGIMAHVTVVQPTGSGGYVTLFPADAAAPPNASTLNPSTPIAFNSTVIGIPTSGPGAGQFALYSTNRLDVVVDVVGYYAPSNPPTETGDLTLITPVRVVDTRGSDGGPIGFSGEGTAIGARPLGAGQVQRFTVAGRSFNGIPLPGDAKGLLMNVTIVQASGTGGGYVTVFPADATAPPLASTVNHSTAIAASFWATGLPTAGASAGQFAVYSTHPLDLVVDVVGYYR